MRRKGVFKPVEHRNEPLDHPRRGTLRIFKTLLLNSLPVIVKVGLPPKQRLAQFFQVCAQLGNFRVGFGGIRGDGLGIRGLFDVRGVIVLVDIKIDFHFLFAHLLTSPVPVVFHVLLSASLKSCATYATAVTARS